MKKFFVEAYMYSMYDVDCTRLCVIDANSEQEALEKGKKGEFSIVNPIVALSQFDKSKDALIEKFCIRYNLDTEKGHVEERRMFNGRGSNGC